MDTTAVHGQQPHSVDGIKAPRVLVVSLRKSGTHLLREVMSALGYVSHGHISAAPTARTLPSDSVWRVLQLIYSPDELTELVTCTDRAVIDEAIQRALGALIAAWRFRFGLGDPVIEDEQQQTLLARALSRKSLRDFSNTPDNVCWFLHYLDIDRVDHDFLAQWQESGDPRIVFNFRDPRDVLLSMVNFLTNGTGLGRFPDHHVYSAILKSLPSLDERITVALTDPFFPGADAFERALWLLRHPQVCAVSFEKLVGPRGGGSAREQKATVRRILDFLDADANPDDIADRIFNRDSFTFHKGQIGSWREHFTPAHERLFEQRYGEILRAYSYA